MQSNKVVGLVFGSDTGTTEEIAHSLIQKCHFWMIEAKDVREVRKKTLLFLNDSILSFWGFPHGTMATCRAIGKITMMSSRP